MKATITLWPSLGNTTGTTKELGWDELFDHFGERVAFLGKMRHPGWSAATFRKNQRRRDFVDRVFAAVLDIDGTWSVEEAEEVFGGYYGLIHTSKSHTEDVHRFRVVLPLLRTVSAFEFDALWRRLDAEYPGRFDGQAKDPSRFWYTPGCADEETPYATVRLDGRPMDPDEWLARPDPHQAPAAAPREAFESQTDVEERASRYLAKMDPAISGSGGHSATWAAALALRGFGLDEHRIFDILKSEYNPRCQPPWSDRELRHKAKQAAGARMPEGFILERDDYRGGSPLPPEANQAGSPARPAPEQAKAPDVTMEVTGVREQHPVAGPSWERLGVKTVEHTYRTVYDSVQPSAKATRCSTGFAQVDKMIGGYRRGYVTVLAAQTSWGKSSWSLQAVDLAHKAGKRVLYVSAEDGEELCGKRLVARQQNINAQRLRDAELTADEMTKLTGAVNQAQPIPWFLNCIGRPAEWGARVVDAILAEEDFDLVIVDYLQAISASAQDRRNEVTKVSRLFSDVIKKHNAAGLLLSQLSRFEEGKRPDMNKIKESGDVENAGEHVLIGWLEHGAHSQTGAPERKRYLMVAKNKDGPVMAGGSDPLFLPFDDYTASFINDVMREAPPSESAWHDEPEFEEYDEFGS